MRQGRRGRLLDWHMMMRFPNDDDDDDDNENNDFGDDNDDNEKEAINDD